MSHREKMLAAAIVALVGLWLAKSGFEKASAHYDDIDSRQTSLERQVKEGKFKSQRGLRAEQRLKEWRKSSLTANRRQAQAQYQQWLRHCATEARLEDTKVDSQPRVSRRKGYEELKFTLHADATLDQVTHFLHEFYRADYLHKISRLHLAPKVGSKTKYDLSVTIRALIIEGAENRDRSVPSQIDRPQFGNLAAYQKTIGGRSLFTEYVPPKPPRPVRKVVEKQPSVKPSLPKEPSFDEAKHTRMTGVTSKSGVWVAWFRVLPTGKTFKLAVGDTLEVGTMNARVAEIYRNQIVLATEGERLLLGVGESLSEALALPDSGT